MRAYKLNTSPLEQHPEEEEEEEEEETSHARALSREGQRGVSRPPTVWSELCCTCVKRDSCRKKQQSMNNMSS